MIVKSRVVDCPTTEHAEDGGPGAIRNRTVGSSIGYKHTFFNKKKKSTYQIMIGVLCC